MAATVEMDQTDATNFVVSSFIYWQSSLMYSAALVRDDWVAKVQACSQFRCGWADHATSGAETRAFPTSIMFGG